MTQEVLNLSEAAECFLKDVGRGHSPATKNTYQVALNGFFQYLERQLQKVPATLPIATLEIEWAINFLRNRADGGGEERQEKAAKATLATYAAALSRFYKWCSIERLLNLPAEDYERMQIRFKEIRGKEQRTILNKVPPDEVVEALLQEVRKPKPTNETRGKTDKVKQELIWLRDIALLETLKCSGARVSELTNLTRGDLDLTNHRARTIGKGNKERWLYFSTAAWEAVEKYLTTRAKALSSVATGEARAEEKPSHLVKRTNTGRNYGGQPLFARHDRGAKLDSVKPLTPRAVQKMIVALVERAELESNITPHKFRHWVATRLLTATGDLAATQDLLGHASPTTTRIYAQVSEQTKQKLHRQVFDGQPIEISRL
ncbi:MAG: tyrosine-type recombinase/integrase [Chloroflexota bacterium]